MVASGSLTVLQWENNPGEKILIASVLTLIDVCSCIDNDFYSIDFLAPLDTQTP